jgi:hypothetical protein
MPSRVPFAVVAVQLWGLVNIKGQLCVSLHSAALLSAPNALV